jgi:hypothetical protein
MGLSPNIWGKEGWHFIHFIALAYPTNPTNEDKENYLKFINSLSDVLPCPFCSKHFKENIEQMPPKLENKESFFNWTVDMHNLVNRDNGKREFSYEEAKKELQKKANSTIKNIINTEFNANDIAKGVSLSISLITIIIMFSYSVSRK